MSLFEENFEIPLEQLELVAKECERRKKMKQMTKLSKFENNVNEMKKIEEFKRTAQISNNCSEEFERRRKIQELAW